MWTASSSTAGRAYTRSPAPCIWTTKSTASSPASASPTSSRRSRGHAGLRLLDKRFKVLAEFARDTSRSVHGFPQANMFDQPELEALLRENLKRYAKAELRCNAEVTEISEH